MLDRNNKLIAIGTVNHVPVEVPSGIYDIRVLSIPERVVKNVRVVESDVELTVSLMGE